MNLSVCLSSSVCLSAFLQTGYAFAAKEMEKLYSRLERGVESETPGLMEQWLREKKLTEEEIMSEAVEMFGAGVDTVCLKITS